MSKGRLLHILAVLGGAVLFWRALVARHAAKVTYLWESRPYRYIATPPDARFVGVAWLRGANADTLALELRQGPANAFGDWLDTIRPDGSDLVRLQLKDALGCRSTSRGTIQALPDGRLGYIVDCHPRLADNALTLWAYDPQSQATTELVPYYLPPFSIGYDFAPGMRQGLLANGGMIDGKFYWLRPDQPVPLDLPLLISGSPARSPDGRTIALSGASEVQAPPGPGRLTSRRNLYLMDADGTHLRPILDNLLGAWFPAWSPDGRWIAVEVERSARPGDAAVVLIEVASGRVYSLLSAEQFGYGGWPGPRTGGPWPR